MRTTETIPPAHGGPLSTARSLPRLRLVYTTGGGVIENVRYTLTIGSNAIGRDKDNLPGITLADDARVSRRHALLHISESQLVATLEDAGSKNGTFVNGDRLGDKSPVALQDGDVVRIGDSWFILRYDSAQGGSARSAAEDENIAELVGISPAMRRLRESIRRIAADPNPALILGETGTGKELVASALHRLSKRSGALLPVNCGAVPETLADGLFFGTAAGAFTGAAAKPGYFKAAQGGTLFLDEIGELPSAIQPKLLRAIDQQEVLPVGETRAVRCDVRLVCATLRDLLAEVNAGRFRQDLYARLSFLILELTPLRERREDILVLLGHCYRQGAVELPPLPAELVDALLVHPWPQNTREVQQVALHLQKYGADAALYDRLRKSATVTTMAPAPPRARPPELATVQRPGRFRPGRAPNPSRKELTALLSERGGVVRNVAQALGCSRRHVGRLIEEHHIDLDELRQAKKGRED